MANNILCIDAGNSAIKWALSKSHALSEMLRLSYPENVSSTFFIDAWALLDKPISIIASNVASKTIWLAITEACNELWNIEVQSVTSLKEAHGLMNAYANPSDLGCDRWCAMIGAIHTIDSAFIIVDAGSAISIDIVNGGGKHIGGYITPGLNMMKQSLGLKTAQIKLSTDKNLIPSLLPANSTVECVAAGIHLSAVKLIEAVFERESKKTKNLECILAGGDAKLIADLLSFKCVIMPDIVLRGLVEIQKNNQE